MAERSITIILCSDITNFNEPPTGPIPECIYSGHNWNIVEATLTLTEICWKTYTAFSSGIRSLLLQLETLF